MITQAYSAVPFTNGEPGAVIGFPWGVASIEDVRVGAVVNGQLTAVPSSAYTVSLTGAEGGNVILLSPLAGQHYIYRETTSRQLVSISNQTSYNANVVEMVWDKLTLILQELLYNQSLGLEFPFGTDGPLQAESPVPGAVLMWDETGRRLLNGPQATTIAGAENYAQAAQAAALDALAAAQEAVAAAAQAKAATGSFPTLAALLADTRPSYPTGSVLSARAEQISYRVAPAVTALGPGGYHRVTSGGVLLQVIPKDGGTVPAIAFGVVANGIVDDTAALQAAVRFAEYLLTDAGIDKQQDGANVLIPKGRTTVLGTVTVVESCITIRGISASASMIYSPNSTWDVLVFERPGWALYNCGLRDVRFSSPGNATGGHQVKLMNCIYFNHKDTQFNGWWSGLYIAAGGKIYNTNVTFSQEVRSPSNTLTGPAISIGAEYAIPGDIHFTDCQVMEDVATAGVNSIVIRAGDGIYWNNCHMHGTTLVEPRGAVFGETTLASLVFTGCYFDASRDVNVIFSGSPNYEYRDVRMTNCYVRGGVIGIRFANTTPLRGVTITGGTIAQCKYWGLECVTGNLLDLQVDGVWFDDNNQLYAPEVGDILLDGIGSRVVGARFSKGFAGGHSIRVKASAEVAQLRDLSWAGSTVAVATRVINLSPSTTMSGLTGFPIKSKGRLVVPAGVTSAAIAHGLAITPDFTDVTIRPAGRLPGTPWTGAITPTQFTIEFGAALPEARTVAWLVDCET